MTTPQDDRVEPALTGDERLLVEGFLDYHRQTLLWKCAELTPEQLRARPLPTTNLSLHGLVRHLAHVERSWFRRRIAGQDAPPIFYTAAEPHLHIDPPAPDRGVRAAQRPRRPAAGGHRRRHRRVGIQRDVQVEAVVNDRQPQN